MQRKVLYCARGALIAVMLLGWRLLAQGRAIRGHGYRVN
jgi:hypothetical protein